MSKYYKLLIKLASYYISSYLTNESTIFKYKKTYSFYMIEVSKISKTTENFIMNI